MADNADKFWGWLSLFIVLAAGVAILTHANGFATAAGTMFTGIEGLGTTLEAGNIASGGQKVK